MSQSKHPALQFPSADENSIPPGKQLGVPLSHPLRADTETCMRWALQSTIGPAVAELFLVDIAQLLTGASNGPLPLHTDLPGRSPNERAHAARVYAVLMFPRECQSTILPKLTSAEQDQAASDSRQYQKLCVRANFFTSTVAAGTILVARGDLLHATPKNRSKRTRLVVYGMFSPKQEHSQFDFSWFPFSEVRIDIKP